MATGGLESTARDAPPTRKPQDIVMSGLEDIFAACHVIHFLSVFDHVTHQVLNHSDQQRTANNNGDAGTSA